MKRIGHCEEEKLRGVWKNIDFIYNKQQNKENIFLNCNMGGCHYYKGGR